MNIRPGTSKSYSLHSYEPEDEYCSNPLKYFIDSIPSNTQNERLGFPNHLTSSSYNFQPYFNPKQVFPMAISNNSENNTQEVYISFVHEIMSELQTNIPINKEINLDNFKVNPCKSMNIVHEPKHCPYYHTHLDKRRNFNSFNYSIEKCIFYETGKCPDNCHYCHTLVEKLYHPLKYKTKFCTSICQNDLKCEYGIYCGFAHSKQEIRAELIDNFEKDAHFFVYYFKTLWCPYTHEHNKSECIYAHNWQDFRRRPNLFTYKAEQCPDWKPGKYISLYSEGCSKQHTCLYSHGWKEPLYHPNFYKTQPCQEGKKCVKKLCPYYHSNKEKRIVQKESSEINNIPLLRKGNMSVILTNINFIKEKEKVWRQSKFFNTPHQKISPKFIALETQLLNNPKYQAAIKPSIEAKGIQNPVTKILALKFMALKMQEEKAKKESKLSSIQKIEPNSTSSQFEEVPEIITDNTFLEDEDFLTNNYNDNFKLSNSETTIGESSTMFALKETMPSNFTKSPIFLKIHEKHSNMKLNLLKESNLKIDEDPLNEESMTQDRIEENKM